MTDLSNNSFIPKRGPTKRRKVSSSKQVYVFTLVSYVLMFSTVLASGGVFFYSDYAKKQLNEQVLALNEEITNFDESEMFEVLEFDSRLMQANTRVENSVSLASVFDIFENTTVETIKIESLELEREGDEKFIAKAKIETDTLDSTIFQRGVYHDDGVITSISIEDLNVALETVSEGDLDNVRALAIEAANNYPVTFMAQLEVPVSEVPYLASKLEIFKNGTEPITIEQPASGGIIGGNEESI